MLSKFKTLAQWMHALENRYDKEIQLGLSRIKQVATILDLLTPTSLVITVAGTNGKGSTVALLESIYHHAGFRVASFTSPHLIVFNERIKINQQMISDSELIRAFDVIEQARNEINLTYFEVVTLAALWHFSQTMVDVIILEVGLGGRLDATNIIDSDLAIITTIDFDHQAYLGDTLEAIGYEKAGIIRKNRPVIYSDTTIPASILNQATLLHAPLYKNGKAYTYAINDTILHFNYQTYSLMIPKTPFHNNAVAAAIMTTLCLHDRLPISDNHRLNGISKTTLYGRLQWIQVPLPSGLQPILLDVAHNAQAACYLASYLKTVDRLGRVYAVFSALADKDIVGLLAPLVTLVDHWYLAALTGKRAAASLMLTSACQENKITCFTCYGNIDLAYQAACNQTQANDLIIVYGSFITVGRVLSIITALRDVL
jgi:dihydrofolate synthase/folylpolyglutamate synthase